MAKYYWSLYGNIYDLLGIKKFSQILNKNTSPYFHSASLVIWPLTMLKRTHFSELPISRFSTYIRKHKKSPRLHTPFSNARSEKRKLQAQNDRAATNPTQSLSTYTVVSFQFTTNSIFPVKPTLFRRPAYTWRLKTSLLTLPPLQTVPRRRPPVTWHQ